MDSSVKTRFKVWWNDFPLCCRVIFSAAVIVYVLQMVGVVHAGSWCFNAQAVYEHFQVYRIFTVAYLHNGLLHIILNLLAMVSLGPPLERQFGTATFFLLVPVLQLISGVLETALARILWLLPFSQHLQFLAPWGGCSIGISGLLFAFITIHCNLDDGAAPRSLFGFCTVPSRIYPWALLVIIYLLWPGTSFAGHLFGIIAGYAAPYAESKLQAIGLDSYVPSLVKRLSAYKMSSGGLIISGVLHNPNASSSGSSWVSRLWRSSSTTPFPGQGRVLGSSPPPPPASAASPTVTTATSEPKASRFPGRGHELGSGGAPQGGMTLV